MKMSLHKLLLLSLFGSCGLFEPAPSGEFPPFIEITVVDPEGFVAPLGETWELTTSAVLNGNPVSNTNDIPDPQNPLPSDLTVSFSEQVRGQNVTIEIEGFNNGVSVFSANGAATAGSASIELVARFCGDASIDDDRSEQCDDGADNSDTSPNACRVDCTAARCGDGVIDSGEACDDGDDNSDSAANTCRLDCQLPSCGDGVTDAGEACDDGNLIDADGCEADCSEPACGNGVLDPEDFDGATCYEPTTTSIVAGGRDIIAADIDADNFPDLVYVDTGANALKVSFGDGQGNFPQTITIALNSNASFLGIGSLGGTEDATDIAVSGFDTKVVLVKHTGPRTFTTSTTQNLSSTIRDFVVDDFNNDNRDDIIAITDAGAFRYSQDTVGIFTTPTSINIQNPESLSTIKAEDLNSDGKTDLIIADSLVSTDSVKLTIARGIGNGTFSFNSIDLPGMSLSSFLLKSIVSMDRDNDGSFEIAVGDSNSLNSAIVTTNNLIPTGVELLSTSKPINSIFSGDFDLDGNDDLLARVGDFGEDLSIFLSGTGFTEQNISTNLSALSATTIFDVNQDGILEIIVGGISIFTLNE
jgi:cysteine-rich repeat protein